MICKKNVVRFMAMLVISLSIIANISLLAFADAGDMDGVGGTTTAATGTDDTGGGGNDDIGNYLEGYNPVDKQDMEKAQKFTSPIANAIGMLTGCIVTLTSVLMFAITALDLLYIAVPFTRPLLTSKWQLVSDEALKTTGGSAPVGSAQGGMGAMGGMGGMNRPGGMGAVGGMGAMGGVGGMGGMSSPMGGAQAGGASSGSTILTYFKNRVIFMIFFAVATVLLLSSLFTGCGVNLARLLAKLVGRFSG